MKRKILYIHHGHSKGGAPRSLSFLIEQLDKKLYEPIVLCIYDNKGNKELFEKSGAEFKFVKEISVFHGSTVAPVNISEYIIQLLKVPVSIINGIKIIKEINPDIIHLNSTAIWPLAISASIVNKEIPVVCHIREPILSNLAGKTIRYFCKKFVNYFISIDKYDATTLKLKKNNLKIVYNFIDLKNYNKNVISKVLRDELYIDDQDIVFLYLARITKPNGAYELVDTFREIKNKRFHLVIVGNEKESMDEYQKKVWNLHIGFEKNIHILDFRNDVPLCIASSDVMIVPFIEPHFGRSIIEAAAMGVPSIATDISGLDELVKSNETGMLIKNGNKEDLIDKILLLGNNKELRKKLGKNAEIFAKSTFSAEVNSKSIFKVYDELLGSK